MNLAVQCPLARRLDKSHDLVAKLASFDTFAGLELTALQWLVDNAEYVLCPAHADLYAVGVVIDTMDIIMQGRYAVRMPKDGGIRDLGEYGAGFVTGVLPFSRMTHTSASLHCLEDTYVLRLHKSCFTEMVTVSYPLVQRLVGLMSNRIREFADIRSQDEKMMSLGKLSAGLAHELNNPSSAIVRSAEELYEQLHTTPKSFKQIMTMRITPAEVDAINDIIFKRIAQMDTATEQTAMQRMDAAEALEDWLDDNAVEADPDTIESFVLAGFTDADLQAISDACEGRSLQALLEWIAKNITLETLVAEIRDSAGRISELIGSVKSYTHMDRDGGRQRLDLHDGLRSTLVMLKHRFKQSNTTLIKDFADGIPEVMAWGGQINQVYTNLIDNAIDAAGDGGTVTIRTSKRGDKVCVEIIDDGPGVPTELRDKIFDPFFTTKDVGKGTGMGLDIVQKLLARHQTSISLDSRPGHTNFSFCLPTAID